MRRLVNYHSSWAREQQVELFEASGIRGTKVLQLVVALTQLEVPQEVVRVSQLRIAYLYVVQLARLRQSGPRPDSRLLRQTALEVLTRSARSDSPRKTRPEQNSPAKLGGGGGGGGGERGEGRRRLTLGDTASRGPTTIVTPESQFRTCPTDHGKASSNIAP
ncbi:hypothetical protein F511_34639 [Dorcoceras hygrometricum]|uniref:Uncharacterized protein n=1 Tax=Dorcoceras hygrometricum TaxID=472368 RepID=A0A2Z7C645_9LAMI|nr:hypothetical protein F511_34639 [Dorcoceras hygrometricum]